MAGRTIGPQIGASYATVLRLRVMRNLRWRIPYGVPGANRMALSPRKPIEVIGGK